MQQFVLLVKALADETRLKILLALQHGELCVCQLTAFLELAPSTVSKHISLLLQAGLVSKRKCGKWAYYFVPVREAPGWGADPIHPPGRVPRRGEKAKDGVSVSGQVSPEASAAHEFVAKSLAGNPFVKKEITRLKKILAVPLDEVCKVYKLSK
jgi:DNA-binding transcriptional ArsR family regulator